MKRTTESEFIEKLHMLRPDLEALETYKGNKKEILFRCKICGYEWRKTPDIIFRSKKCPSCDGKQKLTHDEFVERLQKVSPTIVPIGQFTSTKDKIRCKCLVCNTEWEPVPSNVLRGSGCPQCGRVDSAAGRHNAAVTRNNFALNHPDLALEWDYDRNGTLHPEDFSSGSPSEVWWICPLGHYYRATINSRTDRRGGTGCPECNFRNNTSFPEQAVYFYLKLCFPDVLNNKVKLGRFVIDIYIPSIKTAIEYDGRAWHNKDSQGVHRDARKYELCKKQGITLVRIQEAPDTTAIGTACDAIVESRFAEKRFTGLDACINNLLSFLNVKCDVDTRRDSLEIKTQYLTILQENSLAELYPDVAKEWDYENNGSLLPQMFTPGSQERVWWICSNGHHYPASIASRVRGTGCAKCLGWNKTTAEFREQMRHINPNIEVLGEYVNNRIGILCKCTQCGSEWFPRPNDLTSGSGCPDCKQKLMSAIKKKPVRCIETGEIFESVNAAAQHCGLSPSLISACCRGEKKTGGGYRWEYYHKK